MKIFQERKFIENYRKNITKMKGKSYEGET